jgi:phosphoribosyl-ATP pyrophosphohydrolase
MVDEFCKKQSFDWNDKEMEFKCIKEEVGELEAAAMCETKERELQEVADVLVTVLVYCNIAGLKWKNVAKEFERKMKINNMKPIREESGVKVKKK